MEANRTDDSLLESAEWVDSNKDLSESIKMETDLLTQNDSVFINSLGSPSILFGSYLQSIEIKQEKEPIEWMILECHLKEKEMEMLLLSRYALDSKMFDSQYGQMTWEDSEIRHWLNSAFISESFTEEEQKQILVTKVTADSNPDFNTPQGKDTEDRIFLLSIQEVNSYFPKGEDTLRCVPTDFAASLLSYENNRYFVEERSSCWWWLRTMGADAVSASLVRIEGDVFPNGHFVDSESGCIRPAMWIKIPIS